MSIEPSHRLMLMYDIRPNQFEDYFRYMRGEFIPALEKMGLYMIFAWHIFGDNQPERQIDFVSESGLTMRDAITSDNFHDLESKLKAYTTYYERKIVRFENRFQF